MDTYYTTRHTRLRARLWADLVRSLLNPVTQRLASSSPDEVLTLIPPTTALLADALLAEYDKRWPITVMVDPEEYP